jgi:hypothetical protein
LAKRRTWHFLPMGGGGAEARRFVESSTLCSI